MEKAKGGFKSEDTGGFLYCQNIYRMRAIITRSWFETALNYKPPILDLRIEKLSLFST